jgi:hypothetical protein
MKQERLRICLLMQGGLGWIAGAEYIKNIAIALGSLPPEVRSTFDLLLLCSKTTNADIQKQVKPYLDELLYEEDREHCSIASGGKVCKHCLDSLVPDSIDFSKPGRLILSIPI